MIEKIFRNLPPFKGKFRLARLLLADQLHANNLLIDGKFDCKYYVPNLKENIGFELFITECMKMKPLNSF